MVRRRGICAQLAAALSANKNAGPDFSGPALMTPVIC
jgi:hypothetical protein